MDHPGSGSEIGLVPLLWSPPARALRQLMEDISEECWRATWVSGIELDIWSLVQGLRTSNVVDVDPHLAETLLWLAEQGQCWVVELPGWDDRHPVALGQWVRYYENVSAPVLNRRDNARA